MIDSKGNDALIVAAHNGREKFIEFLLSNETPYNMNLYAINDKGENALLLASRHNNFNIVKSLINKDSKIMQTNENWKPAFIEACKNKNWEIAEYLLGKFKPIKIENSKNKSQKYFLKGLYYSIKDLNDSSDKCKNIKQLIKGKIKDTQI